MPEAWKSKDERMYEKVLASEKERGRPAPRAREIAARTVNRQRRHEGRTPHSTTSGTGNPNSRLEDRSKQELYNRARELSIDGRSKMNKGELVASIRSRS